MRRLVAFLLLVGGCLSPALAAAAPSPSEPPCGKGWRKGEACSAELPVIAESSCPASGDCRVIFSWSRPSNYVSATDTAHVAWAQTVPSAAAFPMKVTRGSGDTLFVTRPPAGGSKSGPVTLCYVRAGWNGQACNASLTWTVSVPATPVDTASGLKLTLLRVSPMPLTIAAGRTAQLCVAARWSNGAWSKVIPWPAACDPEYPKLIAG